VPSTSAIEGGDGVVVFEGDGNKLVGGKQPFGVGAAEKAVVKVLNAEGNVFGLKANGVAVDQQHR
jgi:hypothetical protein